MHGVWDAPGTGFGDLWAALGFVAARGRFRRPAAISSIVHGRSVRPLLSDMVDIMYQGEHYVQVVDRPPTRTMSQDCWAFPRWPSVHPYRPPKDKCVIAYQFDGRSSADDKNPLAPDIHLFHAWAREWGLETAPIGLPLSVRDASYRLSQCTAFVGVCSGMSHLAHSVRGLPVYLLQYQMDVAWWHGVNSFEVCNGVGSFIELFSRRHL